MSTWFHEVGDTFRMRGIEYMIEEDGGQSEWCAGCAFHTDGCGFPIKETMHCRWFTRKDKKNVIFKKIKRKE